jgi:lipopolysaccharide biosynthesis glycosyltransferase
LTNYDIEFKQFEDVNKKGYCSEDKEEQFDEWLDNFDQSFLNDLLQDYLKILQDEYDYLTSIEAIKETILMNEYLFTENGTMI